MYLVTWDVACDCDGYILKPESPKISKTWDKVRDRDPNKKNPGVNPGLSGILKHNKFNKNFVPSTNNPDLVSFLDLVIYNNPGDPGFLKVTSGIVSSNISWYLKTIGGSRDRDDIWKPFAGPGKFFRNHFFPKKTTLYLPVKRYNFFHQKTLLFITFAIILSLLRIHMIEKN